MQWEVTGADRKSGEERIIIIEAETEDSARRRANRRGLLVADARPLDPEDSGIHRGAIAARAVAHAAPAVAPPPPGVYIQNVQNARGISGFGVAALVLGIMAVIICWIPFIGLLGVPLAAIGLLLALIGVVVSLAGRRSSVGMPVAGGVVSMLAIVIAFGMTGAAATSISESVAQAEQRRGATQTVRDPAPAVRWTPFGESVVTNDIEVTPAVAVIGHVPLRTPTGRTVSSEKYLTIILAITNQSDVRLAEYRTWAGADYSLRRDYATLVDEHGNVYARMNFGLGNEPVARTSRRSMRPGESVADVLVFQRPVDAASVLRLEMPGGNIGGEEMIRFEIPVENIEEKELDSD